MRKGKPGDTIYHVCFGDDDNHYFGSIAAIFETYNHQRIGVSKERLWAVGIKPGKPYRNEKCIIYRDVIHRKKTNRKPPK